MTELGRRQRRIGVGALVAALAILLVIIAGPPAFGAPTSSAARTGTGEPSAATTVSITNYAVAVERLSATLIADNGASTELAVSIGTREPPNDPLRSRQVSVAAESASQWGVDALSASGSRSVASNGLTRAGQELAKHGGQGSFPVASGSLAAISRLGQEQLDDILTNPNTITRGINGGNFAGGKYYIAPDGRGAAFDANGTFQYFGVFTP